MTPGRFWGCNDETSAVPGATSTQEQSTITPPPSVPSPTTAPPPAPTAEDPPQSRCVHRAWYGMCKEWEGDNPDGPDGPGSNEDM